MDRNLVDLTIKTQSGGTWLDAEFNVHQSVQHLLSESVRHFTLDPHPLAPYEVLLVTGGQERSLPLASSLADAGVHTGDTVLIRTVGRTVDG